MGDVSDCLRAAYERVLRLIGENSGDTPSGVEIDAVNVIRAVNGVDAVDAIDATDCQFVEDCRKAEHRQMPWLSVDLDETERFVYALACVPGYSGKDVSIGLEPGWLAILAQREAARHKATDEVTDKVTDAPRRFAAEPGGARESATVPEQTFCVMSLPAEVNPVGSIAVLAKGVLGIRMPKARG